MTNDETKVLDFLREAKAKIEEDRKNLLLPVGEQIVVYQGRRMTRDQWRKEFGLPLGSWHHD